MSSESKPTEEVRPTGAPAQEGGMKVDEAGRVTYTREGAVSATEHGPVDPSVIPGQFEEDAPEPGEEPKVITRDKAPGGKAPTPPPSREPRRGGTTAPKK